MAQKLKCIITGKSITVSDEYYQKKIKDFGSIEKLDKFYTCRQAKNLLKRGYTIIEVHNLLKIVNGPVVSHDLVKELLLQSGDDYTLDYTSTQKSDPEVAQFIATLKNL
jgi:hypothetical protein